MSSSSGGSSDRSATQDGLDQNEAQQDENDQGVDRRNSQDGTFSEDAFGDMINAAEDFDDNDLDIEHDTTTLEDQVGDEELSEVEDVPQLKRQVDSSATPPSAVDQSANERFVSPTLDVSSPLGSANDSGSLPDDTPSLGGSFASSFGRGVSPSPLARRKLPSRTPSGALQPFERRFESRASMSPSPSASQRAASPAFLTAKSRQISLSSQLSQTSFAEDAGSDSDAPQAPWDVIRWTKLKKVTSQAFSEAGKRNFGRPTCLAVSALIAIGTSKGLILGFDYHQTLKIIIGLGTKAVENGAVTALAIAADYSTIAAGHASGTIFTWEINKPAKPFLTITPLERSLVGMAQHPDGHISGSAILHIGFLGTRHTALVSADADGMAFSHLATRGMGAIARAVKTTRLLGRYPSLDSDYERHRKPSSVLAFAPLPLGNVEQPTDTLGLTAMLTPYLLVIVSSTPVAQTQYKSPRPKELQTHAALSACLAWFPAVKLKCANQASKRDKNEGGVSRTKLVYCWSNVLTVLEVKSQESVDKDKPADLEFAPRSRWRAEEAIVAVQWLGRSVLGVLTISQRLLIVEDGTLQVTDSIDLLHRHMYHQDLFSKRLHSIIEQLNSADPSMHGVIADAFYMSFRAYKGRAFLLGFDDLTVGTLSNWADRLLALMEAGDHIAAIRLATEYYVGGANNITVGLPDDDNARQTMVKERLLGMVGASLEYTFSQHDKHRHTRLKELAAITFEACLRMQQVDYLFSEVFEWFAEADEEELFVTALEPCIIDEEVTSIPPEVVKTIVAYFIAENQSARLEELLCRLDPFSFDLDQITVLCRQHNLYDALIHIWTQAIEDFVTPLIDLMQLVHLLKPVGKPGEDEALMRNPFYDAAMKIFAYLSYSLTGRQYPNGELMEVEKAVKARSDLYDYLFSGRPTAWPHGSQKIFRTASEPRDEPAFPYLVLLLDFDTASFMSMLNEAFEDPFLNKAEDDDFRNVNGVVSTNGTSKWLSTNRITRQYILEILLDVMQQALFHPEQTIYLDMFISRSLPKYPQQLVFPGSLLNNVLAHLCNVPNDELQEECQLSMEYLLSFYRPTDMSKLISNLKRIGFFRVLKSVYKSEGKLVDLLETFFKDPDNKNSVFDAISYSLKRSSGKNAQAVKRTIQKHIGDLADISVISLSETLALYATDMLEESVAHLQDSYQQFIFLRRLLEPHLLTNENGDANLLTIMSADKRGPFLEKYVQLMCVHDATHVADYVSTLPTNDLHLDSVLGDMEKGGVIDAAVILLARDGLARGAMDRLVTHLQALHQALNGLLETVDESPDLKATQEAAEDLSGQIEKYTKVGIWLCQGQSAIAQRTIRPRVNLGWDVPETDLDLDEYLWLDLIDTLVGISKSATSAMDRNEEQPTEDSTEINFELRKTVLSLRENVQQTFSALMAATATPGANKSIDEATITKISSAHQHQSFLRILRAFLTRAVATAPTLSDVRMVLADIFSAYAFEQHVLSLANTLLGEDTFKDVQRVHILRQRGWRPRSQVCEGCRRRTWGTGIGEVAWEAWIERESNMNARQARRTVERGGGEEARRLSRGKGKASAAESQVEDDQEPSVTENKRKLALVVFACRHVWHRACLDEEFKEGKMPKTGKYRCPLCLKT